MERFNLDARLGRRMCLLRIEPGWADTPYIGERMVLVDAEWNDQIETMQFPLRDARGLALGVLRSLAYHGDATAKSILNEHLANGWPGERNDPQIALTNTARPCRSVVVVAPEPAPEAEKEITLRVQPAGAPNVLTYKVLGGYWRGRVILIMLGGDGTAGDIVVRLCRDNNLLVLPPPDDRLPRERWAWLAELVPISQFKVGKRMWRKLLPSQLRQMIQHDIYTFDQKRAVPTPPRPR